MSMVRREETEVLARETLESWRSHICANFPYEQRMIAFAIVAVLTRKPTPTRHGWSTARPYVTALEIQGELSRGQHERRKPTIKRHLRDFERLGLIETRHDAIPVQYRPVPRPYITTYKKRGLHMNTVLHKDDKNNFAIVTTAESEEAFRGQFSAALDEMIREARYENDWPFHLNGWIEQASEVICRFRGYKSQVVERRTMIAGVLDPDQAAIAVGYQSPVA